MALSSGAALQKEEHEQTEQDLDHRGGRSAQTDLEEGGPRHAAHEIGYRDADEEGTYDTQVFYEMAKGMEKVPEGGERCFKCYRLRMEEAAKLAREGNYDYFTTTLSISPLKNAEKINEIGEELAEIYKVPHLPSDFKKKNGYKRSIELSHEFDLYRQNYCGCVFSKREQEEKLKQKLK